MLQTVCNTSSMGCKSSTPVSNEDKYEENMQAPLVSQPMHPPSPHTSKVSIERSMSLAGNFVRDIQESVWDAYDRVDGYHSNLGKGAGGEVVKAVSKSNKREYAIKIILLTDKRFAKIVENERLLLQDLDHPNCIRLYEVYRETLEITRLWFVMELCTGGHLGQHIARKPKGYLREDTARNFSIQLLGAINHLHSRRIVHRDVKLANILLENADADAPLKLIDFGNSTRFKNNELMTRVAGTTYTSAPEVFAKKGYDEKIDVWSLGVMVYIMLCGRRPFERIDIPGNPTASEASLISNIVMGRYHFNFDPFNEVTDDGIHFICCCLEPRPRYRPTAEQLLQHRWLQTPSKGDSMKATSSPQYQNNHFHVPSVDQQAEYGLRSELARTSMLGVAFSMPPSATKELRALFGNLDADKTGYIDKTEFLTAVSSSTTQILPSVDGQAEINRLFDMIDVDQNQQITFIEFLAAMLDPKTVDVQDLNQSFQLFDKEGKGYISAADIYNILDIKMEDADLKRFASSTSFVDKGGILPSEKVDAGNGFSLSDEEFRKLAELEHHNIIKQKVANMVKECDVDGDGKIRLVEG